jgi:hypothetical protein
MHHAGKRWVALHILNNRSLTLLANLDIQDTGIERLAFELFHYFVVVKHKRARRTAGTIDDCGDFTLSTQAAARTVYLIDFA